MTTSLIPFTPSVLSAFQFQPTLDGAVYTCLVYWNLAGQRYYIFCGTLRGVEVFNLPLIGSPPDYDINIVGGYFKNTVLVYRVVSNMFEVISA